MLQTDCHNKPLPVVSGLFVEADSRNEQSAYNLQTKSVGNVLVRGSPGVSSATVGLRLAPFFPAHATDSTDHTVIPCILPTHLILS